MSFGATYSHAIMLVIALPVLSSDSYFAICLIKSKQRANIF